MLTTLNKDLVANATRAYQVGDYNTAARLFGEAAVAFQENSNFLDAAEMKNNQSVALLQAGNARAACDVVKGTSQVFQDANDFRRQGMAFGNEAAALNAMGRMDSAADLYRAAADSFEKVGEDQLRSTVMQALAGIQLRKGKIMEALLSMSVGLSGVKNPTLKQKILRGLLKFRV